jgi:hypothetical protein
VVGWVRGTLGGGTSVPSSRPQTPTPFPHPCSPFSKANEPGCCPVTIGVRALNDQHHAEGIVPMHSLTSAGHRRLSFKFFFQLGGRRYWLPAWRDDCAFGIETRSAPNDGGAPYSQKEVQ